MSFAVFLERTVQEDNPFLVKFLCEIRPLAAHVDSELCNWVFTRYLLCSCGALDFTHCFPTPDSKRASLLTGYNMKAVFPPLKVLLELLKEVLLF